jgi:hypothetical protein
MEGNSAFGGVRVNYEDKYNELLRVVRENIAPLKPWYESVPMESVSPMMAVSCLRNIAKAVR